MARAGKGGELDPEEFDLDTVNQLLHDGYEAEAPASA
jgi:hypothetical protein